jgi:hypothetical protein
VNWSRCFQVNIWIRLVQKPRSLAEQTSNNRVFPWFWFLYHGGNIPELEKEQFSLLKIDKYLNYHNHQQPQNSYLTWWKWFVCSYNSRKKCNMVWKSQIDIADFKIIHKFDIAGLTPASITLDPKISDMQGTRLHGFNLHSSAISMKSTTIIPPISLSRNSLAIWNA